MQFVFFSNLQRYAKELDFRCKRNGVKSGLSGMIRSSVIEGVSFFLVGWCAFLFFKPAESFWTIIIFACAFTPLLLNVLFHELNFEHRTRKVEQQLPDSLILFASFPTHTSYEHAIALLSTSTSQPIRSEWERMHQMIEKNGDVLGALDFFGEGMDSLSVRRSVQILRRGYQSGIPIQGALAGMAHELLVHHAHFQERNATLLVEKYTLLLAGGILVPVLLGVMVGVVEKLPFNLLLDNAAAHDELFHAALFSIQGYLFLYAGIAGAFVGLQENAKWKMSVYVLALIPLAQIAYFVGRWWMRGG